MIESCACHCDIDDPADVFKIVERTARKRHVCSACGEPIEPGERYTYFSWLIYGSWDHCKSCEFCEKVRRDFMPCTNPIDLIDDFCGCYGFDYRKRVEDANNDRN